MQAQAIPVQGSLKMGDWTVEPDLNQLSRPGKAVKIEPKAMSLLLHLANRPGEVVSREALLAEIWPSAVVGDDSLTQAINKLRKALGDDPDKPTYIQTVTKRGYRLVAAVVRSSQTAARTNAQHRRPLFWIAGAAAAALLVITGLWWTIAERSGHSPDLESVSNFSELPTIAIAPFDALGKESQELLLARGIAADLATDLSKSSGLSVMGFAPMEAHAATEVSNRPRARYLVSGSVQRIEGRLRLHVYLTDQSTGQQLWSERFDRDVTDLFAIQDELAPKIIRVLPAKVSEAELRRMARRHTRNLQAYEYFQRGQAALLVRQKSGNELARQMFRRATELDVTFARAYSGLALTYAADYRNGWTPDGDRALERALELARTANEINPDIPETYWALAYVHAQRRQHEQAIAYLEKSLSLYPSFADGYALMASIKTFVGRPADTVPLLRTAIRLNPKSGYLYFLVLGRAYFFLHELEQARINLDEAMKRNSEYLETHIYMAAVDFAQGDKASAAWEAEQIRVLDPDFASRRWLDNYPMTDGQQRAKLAQVLDQLNI
jgi:DNA-binding winged helix-turn-helix (wHTH) protein/TolB-like protein/cytochrome c-type biogenesis protein CcmH/NrfG